MTSVSTVNPDAESSVKESHTISTIHRIYKGENDEIILRDPVNRRSFINRPAYAKLHRSFSAGSKRHSVDNLKGRFEDLARQNSQEKPEDFTPATFGYPKATKLKPPILKPKPVLDRKRDENSNVVVKRDAEEVEIVLQPTASEESVDKIAKELSIFEMDGKLNRKRSGSIRKFFGLFGGKDKKKKEEEKKQNSDNIKNESNFVRRATPPKIFPDQENHEEKVRRLEREYAQMHIERFNQLRESFKDEKVDSYVVLDSKTKPYNSTPVNRYIDTSSSSTESEKPNGIVRDTPPRAQETIQNIRVVKPRASLPINSERPLPNPYQNEKASPRTIERNLNKSNSKDYPDKANLAEETKIVNSKPPPSPIKLESTKLKLPPNREVYEPQPRVKSPIPTNRVSTDKIIATELLKNSRSPTPPKRPPIPQPPLTPEKPDRIVTNAQVHVPRATTPIDLRMTISQKYSPNKDDVRKSIEEYYWKELKKLKEEEDSRLYQYQLVGDYEDSARVKRSRSLSPRRAGQRSLSLPRETNRVNYVIPPQQPIPEDQAITTPTRQYIYSQNFVRNNPERRSVDSLQRPIFRRGSLTKQEIYDSNPYNKRVSFSNSQQAWPTRNGYTQSPPQRINSELDDDVFEYQQEPVYNRVPPPQQPEPVYTNRVLQQFRSQPTYQYQQPPQQQMGVRRLSMDSLPKQDVYTTRQQVVRRPVSNVPFDDYGRPLVYIQRNPLYSSRQSITDSNYGQKQITVTNKYCDIYGQIHELPRPSGVVMGQLQNSPVVPARQPENFVRGSRLTASANDLGRRYETSYENRPLPPPPPRRTRNPPISDTESGSDASEVQRIMLNKTKNKKRGFFGK